MAYLTDGDEPSFNTALQKKTDAGSLQEAKWGNGYYVWLKSERSGSQSIWTVNRAMWSVGTRLVLRIWSFTVVNRSGVTWSDRLGNVTEINQPWRAGRKLYRSTSGGWQHPNTKRLAMKHSVVIPVLLWMNVWTRLFFILPCRTKCPSFLNKFGTLNQTGVWYMIL